MILNDGDIIYTSCIGIPLCHHVGIVVFESGYPIIYNNSPRAKNRFGGNIVAQPITEFMKGRTFIKTVSAPNCSDVVRKYSYEKRYERWNALSFNCEDYVNDVMYCSRKSQLRNTWQLALLIGLGFFITDHPELFASPD